jgi:hypothetical protein
MKDRSRIISDIWSLEMEITRKNYEKPEIIHELDLETRAGSSPVNQINNGFPEFDE